MRIVNRVRSAVANFLRPALPQPPNEGLAIVAEFMKAPEVRESFPKLVEGAASHLYGMYIHILGQISMGLAEYTAGEKDRLRIAEAHAAELARIERDHEISEALKNKRSDVQCEDLHRKDHVDLTEHLICMGQVNRKMELFKADAALRMVENEADRKETAKEAEHSDGDAKAQEL